MSHVFSYSGSQSLTTDARAASASVTRQADNDTRSVQATPRSTFAPSTKGSTLKNEKGKQMTFAEARWGYENGWSPLAPDAARRRGYMNFSDVRKNPDDQPKIDTNAYVKKNFINSAARKGLYDVISPQPEGASKSLLAQRMKAEKDQPLRNPTSRSGTSTIRLGLESMEFSERIAYPDVRSMYLTKHGFRVLDDNACSNEAVVNQEKSSKSPRPTREATDVRVNSFLRLNDFLLRSHLTSLITALADDGWLGRSESLALNHIARDAKASLGILRSYMRFMESPSKFNEFLLDLKAEALTPIGLLQVENEVENRDENHVAWPDVMGEIIA